MNKVILMGRLTADPELRQTQSGIASCRFTVAVNRSFADKNTGERQADFINCVAWRQTAEFVSRYFKKGNPILVCGQLQTRTWTDNQGQKRYATDVVADEVSFVAPANTAPGQAGAGAAYTPDAYATPAFGSAGGANFEEIPNDESLPF